MKEVKHYLDHFKRGVVNEILSGSESLEYYRRKYKIGGSMTLSRWLDKFASEETYPMASKKRDKDELADFTLLDIFAKRMIFRGNDAENIS